MPDMLIASVSKKKYILESLFNYIIACSITILPKTPNAKNSMKKVVADFSTTNNQSLIILQLA